jgi:hypothetical protein
VVSEKKIFLEINQSETRIACGGHVCKRIKMKQGQRKAWCIPLPKNLTS